MRKSLKSFTKYSMLVTFLAITFLFSSCSWGDSNENSDEEGTLTTMSNDKSGKQETQVESTGIEQEEANTVDVVTDDKVYANAEKMPEYPGGEEALNKYLSENIEYPKTAKEDKIEGKVYIGFDVLQNGQVANVKVLKGIGGGCDEEAVRVVSEMPNWSPGYEKGKPVIVDYTLPINFKLQ